MTGLLQTPRFFGPASDRRLLPEALEPERFRRIVQTLNSSEFRCELTGYTATEPRLTTSDNASAPFLLEWRKPPEESVKVSRKTVRTVEALTYWSRHVDHAIKERMGALIFAPWLTQADINSIFRSAMIARHESEAGGASQQYAGEVLKTLTDLSSGELLMAATGLEYQVERWSAEDWMEGLQNSPTKVRQKYAQTFARHLRFLPSTRKMQPLAAEWYRAAHGDDTPTWQYKALTEYLKHKKALHQ